MIYSNKLWKDEVNLICETKVKIQLENIKYKMKTQYVFFILKHIWLTATALSTYLTPKHHPLFLVPQNINIVITIKMMSKCSIDS